VDDAVEPFVRSLAGGFAQFGQLGKDPGVVPQSHVKVPDRQSHAQNGRDGDVRDIVVVRASAT
jgi:hypothetical protein